MQVFSFRILSLEQYARVLIHSWPLIPDAIALMGAVCRTGTSGAAAAAVAGPGVGLGSRPFTQGLGLGAWG